MSAESYIFQDATPEHDDVDSLPSSIASSDFDSSSVLGDDSDAQKEWEASLQQLELILTMVVVPYAGKYFGRKFAYWSAYTFSVYIWDIGGEEGRGRERDKFADNWG